MYLKMSRRVKKKQSLTNVAKQIFDLFDTFQEIELLRSEHFVEWFKKVRDLLAIYDFKSISSDSIYSIEPLIDNDIFLGYKYYIPQTSKVLYMKLNRGIKDNLPQAKYNHDYPKELGPIPLPLSIIDGIFNGVFTFNVGNDDIAIAEIAYDQKLQFSYIDGSYIQFNKKTLNKNNIIIRKYNKGQVVYSIRAINTTLQTLQIYGQNGYCMKHYGLINSFFNIYGIKNAVGPYFDGINFTAHEKIVSNEYWTFLFDQHPYEFKEFTIVTFNRGYIKGEIEIKPVFEMINQLNITSLLFDVPPEKISMRCKNLTTQNKIYNFGLISSSILPLITGRLIFTPESPESPLYQHVVNVINGIKYGEEIIKFRKDYGKNASIVNDDKYTCKTRDDLLICTTYNINNRRMSQQEYLKEYKQILYQNTMIPEKGLSMISAQYL